ncbi:hypothetical protein AAD018_000790 [Aestuariibius insulae]|uniref:hypothetical protein n=1 Tax=Aestuariibius insulae TaxID=2058287 RepID=UPI00345E112D
MALATERSSPARQSALFVGALLLVFGLAFVSRIAMLGAPPIYDELYQLVPALSYHAGEGFSVLDGTYDRASDFTRLIAASFDLTGEPSWWAARLIPSVLPGVLLVVAIFAWAWHVDRRGTAVIVAVFLILWPNGIEVSQYIRFYALHGLLFVLATMAVYAVFEEARTVAIRVGLLLGAGILLAAAYRLQMLTLLGAGALGLWVAMAYGPRWLREIPWVKWAVLAAVVVVGGVLASGVLNDTLGWLWTTYRWEPWPASGDTTFYHRDFRDNYPTFWPLFPVAALIALRVNFKPAFFCLVLFAVCFVLQTFGGLKNIRYLYPVMPFLFVIWGIALRAVISAVFGWLIETSREAVSPLVAERWVRPVAWSGIVVALAFAFFANAAFVRSVGLIAGLNDGELLGKVRWQWRSAEEVVTPWLERGALVVTTEEMRAVEWLGDYDVGFNRPRFSELLYSLGPDTQAFAADFRTGRPLTGDVGDIERLIACHPVGVVLADAPWARSGNALRLREAAQLSGAEAVLSRHDGMAMLGWEREGGAIGCNALAELEGSAAERILSGARQPQTLSSAKAER